MSASSASAATGESAGRGQVNTITSLGHDPVGDVGGRARALGLQAEHGRAVTLGAYWPPPGGVSVW